jgi:DNA-binding MarR family transcriptional regulator
MSENHDAAALFSLAAIASARYRRAAEARLRPTNLTWAQFGALSALSAAAREGAGLSQAELAHALETDSTTAMVLRGSLEKKGLVDRKDDPDDGRVKRLSLTAQGRRLLADAIPRVASVLGGSGGEPLSEAEVKRAASVLARLLAVGHEAEMAASPRKADNEAPARRGRPRKEGAEAAAKGRGKAAEGAKKRGPKPGAKAAAKAAKAAKAPARKAAAGAAKAKAGKPLSKAASKPAAKAAKAAKTAKAPLRKPSAPKAKAPVRKARAKPSPAPSPSPAPEGQS